MSQLSASLLELKALSERTNTAIESGKITASDIIMLRDTLRDFFLNPNNDLQSYH